MTDIAWRWRWAEVDSELLVSQAVADILDSHRQGLFGVERGGQLFVSPVNPKGLLLAWPRCLIAPIGQAGLG